MPRQVQWTLNPACEVRMIHHIILGSRHPLLDRANHWGILAHLVCVLSNDSRWITWYLHFPAGLYDVYDLFLHVALEGWCIVAGR